MVWVNITNALKLPSGQHSDSRGEVQMASRENRLTDRETERVSKRLSEWADEWAREKEQFNAKTDVEGG